MIPIINSFDSKDKSINFSMLPEIPDKSGCKIIMSITDIPKTVSQICHDNNLPQSSTYKKIKKLLKAGLIRIERIGTDENGKRVVFYRSEIKSLEINLQRGNIFMKYNTGKITCNSINADMNTKR